MDWQEQLITIYRFSDIKFHTADLTGLRDLSGFWKLFFLKSATHLKRDS